MTQPIQPNVDPSQPPVSSPGGQGNIDDEIRQLATALAPDPVTALSGHKAEVTAVDLGGSGTPPTVTVDLGGVSVEDVAIAANYTPQVGDTVVLAKQGNSYVALFRIGAEGSKSNEDEGGWQTASLNGAHAHNGGQTVMYRRINDHGSWKMQWKGVVDYGAGTTSLLASALSTDYRPGVTRQCTVARSVTGGESTARIDFGTDGSVTFWGLSRTNDLGDSAYGGVSNHNHGGSTDFADPPDGLANSHAHGIPSSDLTHAHDLGTMSITEPPWVSLDGCEYFL
jgi:hypothetical protein